MTIQNEFKKIIIARLEVLPHNRRISVGSAGEFTPQQIIESVKKEDQIGKTFIKMEIEFLRALKEGFIA